MRLVLYMKSSFTTEPREIFESYSESVFLDHISNFFSSLQLGLSSDPNTPLFFEYSILPLAAFAYVIFPGLLIHSISNA